MNGHKVPGTGYEQLMAVEIRMAEDPEFAQDVESVAKTVAHMLAQDDPNYSVWLKENGFISKRLVDMEARLLECESVLTSVNYSKQEREKAVADLREIRAASQKLHD